MPLTAEGIKAFGALAGVFPRLEARCKRQHIQKEDCLTADETTADIEGVWRWGTIVYYSATAAVHKAKGVHGSSYRRRQCTPRSTSRSRCRISGL